MFLRSLPFCLFRSSASSISSTRTRMDTRILLLLVLALGISCCCNARVVTTDIYPHQSGIDPVVVLQQQQESEGDVVEELREIEQLCKMCQKIAVPALKFLSNDSTKKTIKSSLDKICSLLPGLKDKCNLKVNVFFNAFFLQVKLWTPKTFCAAVKLCNLIPIPIPIPSLHLSEDSNESCSNFVTEVSLKLKDPIIQLKTTEVLLNRCDVLEEFESLAEKCKMLVFSYAPLILDNAEQFFKSYGMCSTSPNAMDNVDSTFWM